MGYINLTFQTCVAICAFIKLIILPYGCTVYLYSIFMRGMIMKVEVTIERTKKLPDGAIPALENELLKRLKKRFEGCKLTVRRAQNDGLNVIGGDKDEVANILQETWESADEWFY